MPEAEAVAEATAEVLQEKLEVLAVAALVEIAWSTVRPVQLI